MLRDGQTRGRGQAVGYVWEGDKPFYGTRVGPGWYQSGTRVPRGCRMPLSVLRMLMQVSRKPPPTEGRRRNAECRKGGQSRPKPPASQQRGTSEAPASHPHASLKLPSGSPRATPRLPWSQVQAGSLRETRSCFACIPLVFGLCSVRVPLVFRLYSAYMPLILVGPRKGKGGGAGWKRGVAWSVHRSQPTHIASFT